MGYYAKTFHMGTSGKTPLKSRGRNDIQGERQKEELYLSTGVASIGF